MVKITKLRCATHPFRNNFGQCHQCYEIVCDLCTELCGRATICPDCAQKNKANRRFIMAICVAVITVVAGGGYFFINSITKLSV